MLIGVHLSASAGLLSCLERALRLNVEALQLSTRSATRWFSPPLEPDEVIGFRDKACGFRRGALLALASPLINLASPIAATYERSQEALYDEMLRAEALGLGWVVLTAGNHGGRGEDWGLRQVTQSLSKILERTRGFRVGIMLQTAAGDEHSLGTSFEHLARFRRRIGDARRLAVCLDTAHAFAAGYDLRDRDACAATLAELDRHVGIHHVRALHVSDARYPLGSGQTAGAAIGDGEIGRAAFGFIVNDARFAGLPMILHTPKGRFGKGDEENLAQLRSLVDAPVM
jgi:deoxyribonuclease-4